MIKNILELNNKEAEIFFLKNESYFSLELPQYIDFSSLLEKLSIEMKKKDYTKFVRKKDSQGQKKSKKVTDWPSNYENVNYKFLHNKDGRYDWRPFEMIHPVLYVSLVNIITELENWDFIRERILNIEDKSFIKCLSLPVVSENRKKDKAEQIKKWWNEIEQQSLVLGLKFEYLFHTDITDCYNSIYTHSIPWALHKKTRAKEERENNDLLGNRIDKHLQAMSYGQTNGIPQGSILMDFLAELILYYGDELISKELEKIKEKKEEFKILRYRDDYRIFVNNVEVGNKIVKIISETLAGLGLKLHSLKTKYSNNIIQNSLKEDKINWLQNGKNENNLQKYMLLLHKFSLDNPNSGTLIKELNKLDKKVRK